MLGRLRARYEEAMRPLGTRLGSLGLRPNAITTASLVVSCLAAAAYYGKLPVIGGLGLLGAGFVDMLDGAVARATGSATRFGAVYDHVLDRYAEFAILLGIGLGGLVDWIWVMFALFGMIMASFVRAKAESVGGLKSCTVGIAERQEKLALILVGSFLQPLFSFALPVCVFAVGLLSHVTVIQRLHYTLNQTRGLQIDL